MRESKLRGSSSTSMTSLASEFMELKSRGTTSPGTDATFSFFSGADGTTEVVVTSSSSLS